jgi:adenosylcobinamide-GDP ribazoletransferase
VPWFVTLRAGHLVAAIIVVATSLLLTGAMHEDGLADTADALGGGSSRERVLAILKDSRVGTYGAAALMTAILLRVMLLTRLSPLMPTALVLASSMSRLAPVWVMSSLPYVTDLATAKSRAIVAARPAQVVVASLWAAAVSVALAVLRVMSVTELGAAWTVVALVALLSASRFRARVGGITGDFLGATQQVCECAVLLVLALGRGGPP